MLLAFVVSVFLFRLIHGKFEVVAYSEHADNGPASASGVISSEEGSVGIKFHRYGDSLLGAQFIGEEYHNEIPFTAFALMAGAICRVRSFFEAPRSIMQLGLGIGSVPQSASECGYTIVNAVENSTTVASFAQDYFGYNAGAVFVQDVLTFIEGSATCSSQDTKYHVVAQDLYMGWNPINTLNLDVFSKIKENLLYSDGVYVLNFVGYHIGDNSLFSQNVVATLRSLFTSVKCFRDAPLKYRVDYASNIICISSDKPEILAFGLPDDSLGEVPLDTITTKWINDSFQHWEVFRTLSEQAEVIELDFDVAPFESVFRKVVADMRDFIRPLLDDELWK